MVRPYHESDAEVLWQLKRAFELELGTGTGDEGKAATYRDKLDDEYRASYLAWVDRCVSDDEQCIQIAERDGTATGYVFVLPERLAHIWDAAVLNELYVRETHRGTGVADDLMDAALSVAREQTLPLDRMMLDVDPDNERAGAFYERWGFETWGELVARDL